ncbi:hypothetical protein JD543_04870 [Aeromonas caviae]|jgi:hypothetical protein|uniref:hypothetical protein n=1 Tax=Aeromonas caviae TaxID=648 RepID=UPI00191FD7A2|nr:hypothetical protein [Aeromonas caviae]MBL0436796.1 hypothetical protein [Aeromonas caviae]MDH1847986.1 hypothetical protein [Aeromonas caviae]
MIEMLADGSYSVKARGNKMILRHVQSSLGQWSVTTDNASHRAYRGLGVRYFNSLREVEKSYKSWRGIAELVESPSSTKVNN